MRQMSVGAGDDSGRVERGSVPCTG